MDNHGIKMKGDFETDNIKSQTGNDAIDIDDSGNISVKENATFEGDIIFGSPSEGDLLAADSSGNVEWVTPNAQENLLFNYGFDNLVRFIYTDYNSWTPSTFYPTYGANPGLQVAPIGWFYNDASDGPDGGRAALSITDKQLIDGNPEYCLYHTCSTSDSPARFLIKIPEMFETAGKTLTFSCWIKTSRTILSSDTTDYVRFRCKRNYGSATPALSGTSNQSDQQTNLEDTSYFSTSSTWSRFESTFTTSSISLPTYYDSNQFSLCLAIEADSTVNDFDIYIASPKLEFGNIYTGMPIYDKNKEEGKSAMFYEAFKVDRRGVAETVLQTPYTTKLRSKKRKKNSVNIETYEANTLNCEFGTILYYHNLQQLLYNLYSSSENYYSFGGEIYIDNRFNSSF